MDQIQEISDKLTQFIVSELGEYDSMHIASVLLSSSQQLYLQNLDNIEYAKLMLMVSYKILADMPE